MNDRKKEWIKDEWEEERMNKDEWLEERMNKGWMSERKNE